MAFLDDDGHAHLRAQEDAESTLASDPAAVQLADCDGLHGCGGEQAVVIYADGSERCACGDCGYRRGATAPAELPEEGYGAEHLPADFELIFDAPADEAEWEEAA